jgi:hypothetical protein
MNKETVKKVYRKTIATTLSVVAGASISLHNPEKSLAQSSEIPMTPITTTEDIYKSSRWNQNVISQYYNILLTYNNSLYQYLGMPLQWFNYVNDGSVKDNEERYNYYELVYVPEYAINGILNIDKYNHDFMGFKFIQKGIETKKQYADFTLRPNEKCFYTLKVTGVNDQLNENKNLNLNAIVLKREVMCDDNKDIFNTTILKQIAYKYPLDALGEKIQIKNEQVVEKQLDLGIHNNEKAMCGLVAFIQDMKTKEIIAASYADLTPEKTALFNIDHLPETTLDNIEKVKNFTTIRQANIEMDNKKEYQEQIGLRQKVISVTDVQNLRHLDIQLDYTDAEAQIYDVLGAGLSDELQDKAKLTYDPQEHRVTIKFNEPLNGNHDIFSFFIKIKKETINGMDSRQYDTKDVNFKWKTFSAQDSEFNTIKYELREQKNCYPVRMVTIDNPLDFNDDKVINEKDIQEFLPAFGVTDKDNNYINKYDIYPQNIKEGTQGDGRIDVQDLYLLVKEISEQEALAQKIKEINPDFIYPTDESIKAQVVGQTCQLLPPLQLSEDQELNIEAINDYLDTIYSTRDKVVEQIKHTKSFLDRVKDFFHAEKLSAFLNMKKSLKFIVQGVQSA